MSLRHELPSFPLPSRTGACNCAAKREILRFYMDVDLSSLPTSQPHLPVTWVMNDLYSYKCSPKLNQASRDLGKLNWEILSSHIFMVPCLTWTVCKGQFSKDKVLLVGGRWPLEGGRHLWHRIHRMHIPLLK